MDHPKNMTKADRRNAFLMIDAMRKLEQDLHYRLFELRTMPQAWHDIYRQIPEGAARHTKITARFDEDIVKYFKSLGPNYQARMNLVLRAYMHGRLAKIIEGPDATDWILRPETVPESPEAVEIGETLREMRVNEQG